MPSKLSNGCVRYLLESFCDYDSLLTGSRYHRITIPLICRRYFFLIFNGRSYSFYLQYAHAIKLKGHNHDEIEFGFMERTTEDLRLHDPLISLCKLVTITPEIEPIPGRDKYVFKVEGDFGCARQMLKALFENRIPAEYSLWGPSSVFAEEFYDLVATDFSYPAHRLRGKPFQLGHFTSHDPRVFADIKLEWPYFDQYDAPIFHIKTKKLSMYLDSFILYDDLPPMPHLVELECEFGTVGLMINDGALEFYGEIIQRLFAAAPNLNRITLECGASVLGTFTELSEDRVADFFRVLESVLDLFSKHFEKMDVKLDFGVNLPHLLLDELHAKTELMAAIPVPMLFDYHPNDPHVDYYLQMLNDLYYSIPDVPKHLLTKTIGFEIRFLEDVYFSRGDRLRV